VRAASTENSLAVERHFSISGARFRSRPVNAQTVGRFAQRRIWMLVFEVWKTLRSATLHANSKVVDVRCRGTVLACEVLVFWTWRGGFRQGRRAGFGMVTGKVSGAFCRWRVSTAWSVPSGKRPPTPLDVTPLVDAALQRAFWRLWLSWRRRVPFVALGGGSLVPAAAGRLQ